VNKKRESLIVRGVRNLKEARPGGGNVTGHLKFFIWTKRRKKNEGVAQWGHQGNKKNQRPREESYLKVFKRNNSGRNTLPIKILWGSERNIAATSTEKRGGQIQYCVSPKPNGILSLTISF